MKFQPNSTKRLIYVLVALIVIVGLAIAGSAIAQGTVNDSGWRMLAWQNFHISKPKALRVPEKFISHPLEVTFYQIEPGRLGCVGNLASNVSPKTKKAWDDRKEISYNRVQIVLFDLTHNTPEGLSAKIYEGKATQPSLNMYSYPSTLSMSGFSPDGRKLLMGLEPNAYSDYPLILDTTKDSFRGLLLDVGRIQIPEAAGEIWSLDNKHIAYTKPAIDPWGRAEGVGAFDQPDSPITVYIQDWQSKTRVQATEAQGLTSMAWLGSQMLVYGALPKNGDSGFTAHAITKNKLPRPNIYSYSLADQKTKVLIPDGYRPAPSPNGQWVAFFGSRDPKKPQPLRHEQSSPIWLWRYVCAGASLCVAKADGTGRIALQPYEGPYPRIQWLPDNIHFATITLTKTYPVFEAEVTLWNVETQTFKKLATLHAPGTHSKPLPFSGLERFTDFPFTTKGTSQDGKKIYIAALSTSNNLPHALQSIDVETGTISTIATIKGAAGFDWTTATSD